MILQFSHSSQTPFLFGPKGRPSNSACVSPAPHETLSPMDPLDVAMESLENEIKRMKREIRRIKRSLRAWQDALERRLRELEKLKRMKQELLAKEAALQKLVDNFMVSLEANPQDFDANAMRDAIRNVMNSDDGGHDGDNGGLAADQGGINGADPETAENLGEEATIAAILVDMAAGQLG